jgi:hypothetical protein
MILFTHERDCCLLLFAGMRSKRQVSFGKINIRATNAEIPYFLWILVVYNIFTITHLWFVSYREPYQIQSTPCSVSLWTILIFFLVLIQPWWCDCLPDLDIFKRTVPQRSLPNVTYVVAVAVDCSYCIPDDGYGNYPKHAEWSCNKIKILVMHLVGHFMCIFTI